MDDKIKADSGVLLVDKPVDWTSHDVVKFIRRFGFKKVGHCGTLDPAATGLLVIVLGRCTKLTDRFSQQDKIYEGEFKLGIETDSQDREGEIIATHDWSHVTEESLRATVAEFTGELMQTPPMVSAVKQGGKKLYELARQGITVEREARPITVHRFDITRVALPEAAFEVHCTKGTYVRTLASDIGDRLECGAYLSSLRRLGSGRFHVDQAASMEDIKTWAKDDVLAHMIPLEDVLTYV